MAGMHGIEHRFPFLVLQLRLYPQIFFHIELTMAMR
jgi:hypothetical protein